MADEVLERFNTLVGDLKDTQGEFTQTTFELDGSELQSSAGTFSIQRPNKLRWETVSPWPQLLVVNGSTVWLYDPDFEQATYSQLNSANQANPALLFSGDTAAIAKRYTVAASNTGYILEPKDGATQYRQLNVEFSNGNISAISYIDFAGQKTNIQFSNMVDLVSTPAELFTFTPPEGVEVVQSE